MRVGDGVILVASGRYVAPLDLRPDDVDIEDIAHALSHQCRYSGHTREFYSVAEHSVRVSWLLEDWGEDVEEQLVGLLHDAAEAYLVDLPRPLKDHEEFGLLYREAETRAWWAIAQRFHLTGWWDPIKAADLTLMAAERRDLMPPEGEWAVLDGVKPLPTQIVPWSAPHARHAFLTRFEYLSSERR